MVVFLIALLFLLFFTAKLSNDNISSALSLKQTQAIKGFFVVTVLFSHFCSYVFFDNWYDKILRVYCNQLGQLMVVPFLFYSGYGIFESYENKGSLYLKFFPKLRILKTLLHFDLAIFLFFVYDIFFAQEKLSLSKIFLSLIAWDHIGNSNWFIFAIICSYIFCYISLLVFKGNRVKSLLLITFFCILYVIIVSKYKASFWFDTILAFPLGCTASVCKKMLTKKTEWKYVCVIGLIMFCIAKKEMFSFHFINSQIAMISFIALILSLSMKFKIESKILSWFGSLVFEIYILQRLPMNFGKYMQWNEQNVYLYFLFVFFATILLSVFFHKITHWIDTKLF